MRPLYFRNGILELLDQRKLPTETIWIECKTYIDVAKCIKDMVIRGAPAIGVTAAYGMILGLGEMVFSDKENFFLEIESRGKVLKSTRPTAVNLFWAVDRIINRALYNKKKSIAEIITIIEKESLKMDNEDVETNRSIGKYGNAVINENDTILTHCNAGALATCDYGTALGVIRAAHEDGKNIDVYADETRPYLQGSRLTAWELKEDGIPVTLICDNMAGYFIKKGIINLCIVGADRIASNGDIANKIGTYTVAVLARENNIPFYVAAPLSTIDISIKTGEDIIIEERDTSEVTEINGKSIAPNGINVRNPAFDVTPNKYIKGIITEKGIIRKPYKENIRKLFR